MLTQHEEELFNYIADHITVEDAIHQLAEEASELSLAMTYAMTNLNAISQQCAKYHRTTNDSNNVTPVSEDDILRNIKSTCEVLPNNVNQICDERDDFINAYIVYKIITTGVYFPDLVFNFNTDKLTENGHKKLLRWAIRLGYIHFDFVEPKFDAGKLAMSCVPPVGVIDFKTIVNNDVTAERQLKLYEKIKNHDSKDSSIDMNELAKMIISQGMKNTKEGKK